MEVEEIVDNDSDDTESLVSGLVAAKPKAGRTKAKKQKQKGKRQQLFTPKALTKKAKRDTPTSGGSFGSINLSEEQIAKLKKEKSFTTPFIRTGISVTSPVWVEGYFQLIELTLEGKAIVEEPNGFHQYPGLFKLKSELYPCVCMICFKTDTKSLEKCLFSGINNYNPSNLRTHLQRSHDRSDCPKIYNDNVESKVASLLNYGRKTGTVPEIRKFFKSTTDASDNIALIHEEINENLYKFFNSSNIATQQASNEYLYKAMRACVCKAAVLPVNKKSIRFSRYKYINQRDKEFATFSKTVEAAVVYTSNFYALKIGSEKLPFICVSHDGWDSKRHDILGVSIHFVVPFLWMNLSIPIGLKYIRSKKSEDTVLQINKILRRYRILKLKFYSLNKITPL